MGSSEQGIHGENEMKIQFLVRGFHPEQSASGNLIKPLLDVLKKNHEIHLTCFSTEIEDVSVSYTDGILIKRIGVKRFSVRDKIRSCMTCGNTRDDLVKLMKASVEEDDRIHDYKAIIAVTYEEILGLITANIDKRKKYGFLLEKLPETHPIALVRRIQKKVNTKVIDQIVFGLNKLFCLPIVYEKIGKTQKSRGKIIELEHPMIDKKNYSFQTPKLLAGDGFKMLYAGGLDRRQRNPSKIIKAFLQVDSNLHMDFFTYGESYHDLSSDRVRFYKAISKSELVSKYSDYSFMLVIGNKESDIFPSKIFDCISTGIPFVYVSRSHNDLAKQYLDKYDYAYIVEEKEMFNESIKIELAKFMSAYKYSRNSFEVIAEKFEQCTPERNAEVLIKAIS